MPRLKSHGDEDRISWLFRGEPLLIAEFQYVKQGNLLYHEIPVIVDYRRRKLHDSFKYSYRAIICALTSKNRDRSGWNNIEASYPSNHFRTCLYIYVYIYICCSDFDSIFNRADDLNQNRQFLKHEIRWASFDSGWIE